MRKSRLLLFVAFFLFIGVTGVFLVGYLHKPSISKILKSDAYSYLSKEAKEYIEEVYETTGEIVRTEKNKEENIPYLNPKYAEYLSATEEERGKVGIIPTAYLVEFSELEEVKDPLPGSFDLRNVSGSSYVSPLKNQGALNLCWDFATVSQIESYLMYQSGRPYDSSSLLFSTRQIDYAASTDGIKDYENENGTRPLADGGNFLTATLLLYNGLGLVKQSDMPFTTSMEQKELSSVLNYSKSLYELNSTALFPSIAADTPKSTIDSYVSVVKQYVMENGGVYVETEAPGYSCGSDNANGTHIIRVDDGCTQDSGHAMQIIGWDDNYTYSYCKSGNAHSSNVSGCSSANLVSGQGAWLLRNSWGNSYSYVYLAYDSIEDVIYSFNSLSSMNNRTWDNNYHKTVDSFVIYHTTYDEKTFTKKIDTTEKVEKVKFISYGQNGLYQISIVSGNSTYTSQSFTVPYPGVYTLDLSDKNILLEDSNFRVTIMSINGVHFLTNTASVFTSNVDKTPAIQSEADSIALNLSNTGYSFRNYAYTKNISSNTSISYSLWNYKGENISNHLTVQNTTVAKNDVNTLIGIDSSVGRGRYTLKLAYQDVIETVPITIGDVSSWTVSYFANDGTTTKKTQTVFDNTSFVLDANTFTRTGYVFNGWNTEANGTGESFEDEANMDGTSENISLYAQWTPITYKVHYIDGENSSLMEDQTFTYDQNQSLSNNLYSHEGYVFDSWNTKADGSGDSYQNQASVSNLSSVENEIVNLYAQWNPITYNIRFVANGGAGVMNPQTFSYDQSTNLNKNVFSRTGYSFVEWNTKADGRGNNYQDEASILNLTSISNTTITFYAQWTPITYSVRFDSNGGTGSMENQIFTYNQAQSLRKNTFTYEDYVFVSWNTKANGRGTTYVDEESVRNLSSTLDEEVVLYAQWRRDLPYVISHYIVDYDKNYIDAIEVGTTLETYQTYFGLEDGYSMVISLDGKNAIYTGSQVKIYEGETLKATFTNIVRGDVNGDGKISALDYVKVKNHITGANVITNDVYKLSADANVDDKISALDYVRIKNIIINGGGN